MSGRFRDVSRWRQAVDLGELGVSPAEQVDLVFRFDRRTRIKAGTRLHFSCAVERPAEPFVQLASFYVAGPMSGAQVRTLRLEGRDLVGGHRLVVEITRSGPEARFAIDIDAFERRAPASIASGRGAEGGH